MVGLYATHLPSDLTSRWIRVLDLKPSRFGSEDTIRGSLRVVSLDDNPSYEALSYAWGNPSPSQQIICAEEKLSITTNCYDALRQLRSNLGTTTIWVDSICINQSDEKEKAHQVALMRDIYGKATRVYIWLGKGNQYSDYALDWLRGATLAVPPTTGAKIAVFDWSMRPRELLKILRILRDVAIAGELTSNPNCLLAL
jgi:hypothetical protein